MSRLKEKWNPVTVHNGYFSDRYEISNLGNIRSIYKKVQIRKLNKSKLGYLRVLLSKKGISKMCFVHRLVAEAFIPNPENKPQVNHKRGNKLDNRVVSLEWATVSENTQHAYNLGLAPRGSNSPKSKLNELEVLFMCKLIDDKESHTAIAKLFKVDKMTIGSISTGYNWNWLTNRKGNVNTDQKGSNHPMARPVENCRGEVFGTAKEASKLYGISDGRICIACKDSKRSAGKYPDGTFIKWKYYQKDIDR